MGEAVGWGGGHVGCEEEWRVGGWVVLGWWRVVLVRDGWNE